MYVSLTDMAILGDVWKFCFSQAAEKPARWYLFLKLSSRRDETLR